MAIRLGATPSPDAITRASSRISLLWCAVAVVSVPFALRTGWQPAAVAVEVALAACFAVSVQAFVRRGGRAWAASTLGTLCVTTALVSAAGADALRPEAAHQMVSWTNAGIGAALALRFGARGASPRSCSGWSPASPWRRQPGA